MSYPPPHYTDDDPAYARRLIRENGFAVLIAEDEATHLPLMLEAEGEGQDVVGQHLVGHLSRRNPIAVRLVDGTPLPALAIFTGPHAYIPATTYDAPARSVPTWNYASVQVRGVLSVLPDAAITPHMSDLAAHYEARDGWSPDQAADYVAAIRSGIIAITLRVERVDAYRKMSVNTSPAIQKRIIDAAVARGDHAFAREMTLAITTDYLETQTGD